MKIFPALQPFTVCVVQLFERKGILIDEDENILDMKKQVLIIGAVINVEIDFQLLRNFVNIKKEIHAYRLFFIFILTPLLPFSCLICEILYQYFYCAPFNQ